MVAQANTGTPGHINSLAVAGEHLVDALRQQTSRPATCSSPTIRGSRPAISSTSPCWRRSSTTSGSSPIFGSTIHHTDIGGYGVGAGARDVHEEGLWIPPLKLYERGEPNEVLHAMIRRNVRTPDTVFGDLAAQVSSGTRGRRAADRHVPAPRPRRHRALSDEIIRRSEEATRAAIRKLKAGTFIGESQFDVPGGEVITLKAAVTIDPDDGEITIDFAGSSPQSPDRHQRGAELHPRLFHLRGAQLPQSRAAEQLPAASRRSR